MTQDVPQPARLSRSSQVTVLMALDTDAHQAPELAQRVVTWLRETGWSQPWGEWSYQPSPTWVFTSWRTGWDGLEWTDLQQQ